MQKKRQFQASVDRILVYIRRRKRNKLLDRRRPSSEECGRLLVAFSSYKPKKNPKGLLKKSVKRRRPLPDEISSHRKKIMRLKVVDSLAKG